MAKIHTISRLKHVEVVARPPKVIAVATGPQHSTGKVRSKMNRSGLRFIEFGNELKLILE